MNFRGACLHEGCPCAYRDPLTGMCQSPYDKCHISNTSFITKHSEEWNATKGLQKMTQPKTNYQAFLEHMTPDMLALLLAENRCTNTCICCSEMDPYGKPGNASCDLRCIKHTLEYLNKEYSEETFNRVLRFFYIPKGETDEC